jgi:hypothetical protein
MTAVRPLIGPMAAAVLLASCGVRGQAKPEKIDTPASSPTPTPTIQHSTCPNPAPTNTTGTANPLASSRPTPCAISTPVRTTTGASHTAHHTG